MKWKHVVTRAIKQSLDGIVTMQKIATIAFLDTGCLTLTIYCFLFGQKSIYLVGGQNFSIGATVPNAPWPRGFSKYKNGRTLKLSQQITI